MSNLLEVGTIRTSSESQAIIVPSVAEPRVTGSLTLRQAAQVLGVDHSTLGRWIRDGEGPKTLIKPGRRPTYRINAADLERFRDRNSRGGK